MSRWTIKFTKLSFFIYALTSSLTFASGLTSKLSLVSDDILRGLSKTDHSPALRGSMQYHFDMGLGFGLAMANTGADEARGMETQIEIIYSYSCLDKLDLFITPKFFTNIFTPSTDTFIVQAGFVVAKFIKLSQSYSPKYFGRASSSSYTLLEAWFDDLLVQGFQLYLSAGYSIFSKETFAGNKNYLDYQVALRHSWHQHKIGLFLVGSNRQIVDVMGLNKAARDLSYGVSYEISLPE